MTKKPKNPKKLTKVDKVYHIGDKSRLGVIRVKGEQVSEVKWDDDGKVSFVSNDMLRELK